MTTPFYHSQFGSVAQHQYFSEKKTWKNKIATKIPVLNSSISFKVVVLYRGAAWKMKWDCKVIQNRALESKVNSDPSSSL